MSYHPMLDEDEVRYICSVIPQKDTVEYFKQNPKEFQKICPGFRASSITQLDVGHLLFRYRNRGFVSSFIEKHISDWLSQIKEHVDKCLEDGDTKDISYIHTLPHSFFAGNVALYFKLIEDEHSDEYIKMLASAVKAIKEVTEEKENLQTTLRLKESIINQQHIDLNSSELEIKTIKSKLNKYILERKTLKRTKADLEMMKADVKNRENVILTLKAKIMEQEETAQDLRIELSVAKDNYQHIEENIKTEVEKQQDEKAAEQKMRRNPIRPKDLDEFKDYLGYNLENIGIPAESEYYPLLKEHLSSILFQGIPIVINRGVGMNLLRCIANALIGFPDVKILSYENDISIQTIDDFLSGDGRVVCLDNFIGNINETELLRLFDEHQNKIIFLTVAYDRTLYFIPDEFLSYCHYLNLNRIKALSINSTLTEDPSIIEEIEVGPLRVKPDSRYSLLFREILSELRINQSLVEYKVLNISSGQDLCRMLAFDILPYCIDVLHVAPYNVSERLIKYAGNAGSCPNKNLFKGWFM